MEASCIHLPTELWLQILQLAAKHPTKDEFADQAESYEGFPRDSSTIFTQMEHGEESMLLETRLTLALVCKTWHPIGIEILWSHLRIILNESPNTIEHILEILQRKPYLGKLVKRLSIRAQTAPYNGWEEHEKRNNLKFCMLLSYLPHIDVLTYPSIYSIPEGLTRPAVATVYRGASRANHREHHGNYLHNWYHTRMLSLDPSTFSFPHGSSFPHLETLYIALENSALASYVTRMCTMPTLRFLSILGGNMLSCASLLHSVSATLEYLQLKMRIHPLNFWPIDIELPKLMSLYISLVHKSYIRNSTIEGALSLINAPGLRRLGIYEITLGNPPSSELVKHIDAAIKAYPSLEEISLEGRTKLIGTDDGIPIPNMESWCKRGIQVKVRTGRGAWTTYAGQ